MDGSLLHFLSHLPKLGWFWREREIIFETLDLTLANRVGNRDRYMHFVYTGLNKVGCHVSAWVVAHCNLCLIFPEKNARLFSWIFKCEKAKKRKSLIMDKQYFTLCCSEKWRKAKEMILSFHFFSVKLEYFAKGQVVIFTFTTKRYLAKNMIPLVFTVIL